MYPRWAEGSSAAAALLFEGQKDLEEKSAGRDWKKL